MTHECQYSFWFKSSLFFPAQLVRSVALGDLLDKPWSQVSPLLPPGTRLHFFAHTRSSAFPLFYQLFVLFGFQNFAEGRS